jgi:hypothetical protein
MAAANQFTLRYLFAQTLWVACGLGFAKVAFDAAVPLEVHAFALPLAGASFGAAIGGLRRQTLEGAKAGLLVGFAFMPLFLGYSAARKH